MRRYVVSEAATDDLDDTYHYIARNNRTAAAKLLRGLDADFERIADNPDTGRRYENRSPYLQVLVSGKYLVFYRIEKEDAIIVRVIHGARDLSKIVFE